MSLMARLLPSMHWILRPRFIGPEEQMLSARFGSAYDTYCGRVNRWLGRRHPK